MTKIPAKGGFDCRASDPHPLEENHPIAGGLTLNADGITMPPRKNVIM